MTHIDTHTAQTLTLTHRLRRLRRTETMRALVRETRLSPDMFVLPLFVCEGEGVRREVPSMPGVCNLSVDEAVRETAAARADGVKSVILFGIPDQKDAIGSPAYDPEAPVQSAIRAIKREMPDVLVVTDVCLCEYTDHGHCGIVIDGEIANDPTVEQLVRAAVSHAAAGADIVAPSDMMDGRVGAIRQALDERGFEHTAIMAYAAKYPAKSLQLRSAVGFCGATEPLSPITSVVTPWRILLSALPSTSSEKSECECGSMKPGASALPPASIVRAAGPETRPTPVMRPSRTATEPVTDGPPVPSMIRALVMRRSKGRAGC